MAVPFQTSSVKPKVRPFVKWSLKIGLAVLVITLVKSGNAHAMSAGDVYAAQNQQRVANGEAALNANGALSQAAANKAADMFRNNYWAHVSPSGTTPWYWITAAGYSYRSAGENLSNGYGTAAAVVTAWMNSPEHRANVLNGNFSDVGIAVASGVLQGQQTILVVAEYGQPYYVAPPPPPPPAPTPVHSAPVTTSAPATVASASDQPTTEAAAPEPTPPAAAPADPAPAVLPTTMPAINQTIKSAVIPTPKANWWEWLFAKWQQFLHAL